jgi:hypothetical protein
MSTIEADDGLSVESSSQKMIQLHGNEKFSEFDLFNAQNLFSIPEGISSS